MADTTVASVIQVLPPYKGAPSSNRSGGAAQTDVQTAAPHVEQARLIGSESSIASVTRQTNVAKTHGVALYQTVQETLSPQDVSTGEQPDDVGYRPVNLFA